MTDKMRYFITTYTSFSHTHVINLLSSNDAQYRYQDYPTEESYSKFEILSDRHTFEVLREASKENNGSAFSIEYGTH
jgi:hypothetical protein